MRFLDGTYKRCKNFKLKILRAPCKSKSRSMPLMIWNAMVGDTMVMLHWLNGKMFYVFLKSSFQSWFVLPNVGLVYRYSKKLQMRTQVYNIMMIGHDYDHHLRFSCIDAFCLSPSFDSVHLDLSTCRNQVKLLSSQDLGWVIYLRMLGLWPTLWYVSNSHDNVMIYT